MYILAGSRSPEFRVAGVQFVAISVRRGSTLPGFCFVGDPLRPRFVSVELGVRVRVYGIRARILGLGSRG